MNRPVIRGASFFPPGALPACRVSGVLNSFLYENTVLPGRVLDADVAAVAAICVVIGGQQCTIASLSWNMAQRFNRNNLTLWSLASGALLFGGDSIFAFFCLL